MRIVQLCMARNWPRSICIMLSLNGWRVAFTQQFMPERKNLARKKMLNYRCKVRFESNKFPGASLNGFAEQNEKNKIGTKAVAHRRGRDAVRRA